MQQRRDEILAKKARLAELKRQRELRRDEFSKERQSTSELASPSVSRSDSRKDLDSLISTLVDTSRPSSTGPRDGSVGPSSVKGSRPSSISGAEQQQQYDHAVTSTLDNVVLSDGSQRASSGSQRLSIVRPRTIYECTPPPIKEVITYSVGVQTAEQWSEQPRRAGSGSEAVERVESDGEQSPSRTTTTTTTTTNTARNSKRLSRRDRENEKVLRANIRREIGDELKAIRDPTGSVVDPSRQNFPARALTEEELEAITSSNDFLDFVDRSTKVIERALDEEYDVLADYAIGQLADDEDEDGVYDGGRRKGRSRLREVKQYWDARWSKRRMVTSIDFSPKFPELLLSAHTKNITAPHEPDGVLQVWNLHLQDRPEYIFHAQSDILVAKFSPFHPNLMFGGTYSGEVLLWDTRARWAPVQKSPLTGSGHSHPIYAIDIVGTPNAHNIISCATDGTVCGWTVDMLSQPQELFELLTPPPAIADGIPRNETLAPTCLSFPRADPTYFLVGTEDGGIYPCHRYDRADAKAGVDPTIRYGGHTAPITSVHYHPGRGPVDLEDLVLSTSLDWSIKLWKVRAPGAVATTTTTTTTTTTRGNRDAINASTTTMATAAATPVLDLRRDDIVYDANWSPVKPGVFAAVDGAGQIEVWDLTVDTEVPVTQAQPSSEGAVGREMRGVGGGEANSLNRVSWDAHEGKRLAVGGLSGAVTVFEVGSALGGRDSAKQDEWTSVKRLVGRLSAGGGSR
ncbi:MAG: hypothetical protein M1823_001897 [Watsoniomyces obsoletus]|nr:MAG: hypothetical protein M1823_001897 [Watsoniomyces obsoletus]